MPIYEYIAKNGGCDHCHNGFEVLQKLSDPELSTCPECQTGVSRKVSAPNIACGHSQSQKESHLEKNGFTQYRKAGGGVYEKTAGKGPNFISAD